MNGKVELINNETTNLYDDDVIPSFVDGFVNTSVGKIRRVKTTISTADKIGGYKVRWGIKRYEYRVSSGIYAVGNPDDKSPVLVTANYKLSFDALRKELTGHNLWIIVLDTKGINVWCAAGKGTFGTYELLKRINIVRLKNIISHNNIILPQLGAVGVSAHIVAKAGFKVIYGPIKAEDIPAFLNNNLQVKKEMRKINFDFKDRLILTPMEIIPSSKYIIPIFIILLAFNLVSPAGFQFLTTIKNTFFNFLPYLGALFLGAFLMPVMLPYIPFRSFSLKGGMLGAIWAYFCFKYSYIFLYPDSILVLVANTFLIIFITAYISLQFTGSSTYTSLSGTRKETVYTIIFGGLVGFSAIILMIVYKVFEFI